MITSEEIADGVVAVLNAIEEKLIAFEANNPPVVPDYEKERAPGFRVHVVPFAEDDEALDHSDAANETLKVNVILQGPITQQLTRKLYLQAQKQMRIALREVDVADYAWQGNETASLFDADALRDRDEFLSVFRPTYYGIG